MRPASGGNWADLGPSTPIALENARTNHLLAPGCLPNVGVVVCVLIVQLFRVPSNSIALKRGNEKTPPRREATSITG